MREEGHSNRAVKLLSAVKKFFALLMVCAILLLFAIPSPAEAGIFSFFEKLFGGGGAPMSATILDARTMPLLDAPTNPDPQAGRGGGDINIVQNSALLPVTGPLGSLADVEEIPSDKISVYVVREGDNLSQIAGMFRVSVNTIVWANNIRGDRIIPGQTLVILPISGVRYTVKEGDTLQKIAVRYDGSVEEILQFNALAAGAPLVVGQEIVVPNGEIAAPRQISSSGQVDVRGTGGPVYAAYYIRPINGGRRSQGLHGYNGVDLATSCGEPVLASAAGDVFVSRAQGWNGGYGEYLVIGHQNGTQTLYSHLQSIVVGPGWHVAQGQVIGYVGSTGNSTGCHLHFEVRGAQNPFAK